MHISTRVYELVIFLASLAALVGLQFAPHIPQTLMYALCALMGGAAGHGMGAVTTTDPTASLSHLLKGSNDDERK